MFIINIDYQITDFINRLIPHNHFFDLFFSFFSLKGNSIFIWILIIAAIIIIEEVFHPGIQKRDKMFIFYFLISFLLTALIVNYGLKNIFQRPRPYITNSTNSNYLQLTTTCPKDFSFPSSHAATAFAAAGALTYFDKKRRYFYYLVASLISLSRIYLGCHFFLDVLAGAIIGYLINKLVFSLIKYPVEHQR